jgi:hypothetical protein
MDDTGEQDGPSRIVVDMALDDYESLMRLCADIRGFTGHDALPAEDRLAAIHQALTEATGGNIEKARDFLRDVTLGLLKP